MVQSFRPLVLPREDVLLDESGVDTWSSCRNAAREFGLRRVTVVTTDFHLPRASQQHQEHQRKELHSGEIFPDITHDNGIFCFLAVSCTS